MELPELVEGRLVRRYRRFLADVRLVGGADTGARSVQVRGAPHRPKAGLAGTGSGVEPLGTRAGPGMAGGAVVTVHCPNTGSLRGCAEPGLRVWLSRSANPRRRLPWTWELVETASGALVCINTARSNALVAEAIAAGRVPALAGYATLRREVRFGREGSRVDLLLEDPARGRCFVEVKHVTAVDGEGLAIFPDAATARGRRHLRELAHHRAAGDRAVALFCVARADAQRLRPADEIDPAYGEALRAAVAAGVEALALGCDVTLEHVVVSRQLGMSLAGYVGRRPTRID